MADYEELEVEDQAAEGVEPEDDEDLLEEAKERFTTAFSYYSTEYTMAENDFNFVYGDQWPEDIRERRRKEFRPCLTQNQCLPFVHKVVNDIKQSRPSIRVSPVDDQADIDTANVLKGMIKNIEVTSNASNAYDSAAMNSVGCGYGWLRINTEFADDTSFDKEICIGAPLNPFSVLIDPNHKKQDGSDMEYAFIYDDIPEEDFERMYPNAQPVDFDSTQAVNDWRTDDTVRIAEYFYKEYTKRTIVQTNTGQVFLKEEMPEGMRVINEREIQVPIVKWCKLSGVEILEKTEWEGKYIPIVPVYGEIVWNEGRRRAFSLIHQAIDPQQMLNYWLTANTEIVALQPKSPYIGAVGQFKSKRLQWMNANTSNAPYLEYDPVSYEGQLVGAPRREPPPQGSPAMTQGILMAVDGIKSSLGIFDASLGRTGNEQSGKAILARQQQGDNATFHFMDNLSVAMRQVGMILIDLIPKIYSGKRIARIIGDDGEEKNVPINQSYMKDQQGNLVAAPNTPPAQAAGIYNLDVGKYDVVVDVGPSYSTKRQEVVQTMLELAKADPRVMEVGADIFFKNLDVPQAKELADRMKSVMDPNLFGDDPNAAKLQQATQMIQAMQQQMAQMDAALKAKQDDAAQKNAIDKQKADTETQKAQAEIERIKAETAKILADISAQTQGPVNAEAIQALMGTLAEMDEKIHDVGEAVHHILTAAEGGQEQVPSMPENNMDVNQPMG